MTLYRDKKDPAVVIDAAKVSAADYNPALLGTGSNPWDGMLFDDLPDWLEEAITDARVLPHSRNETDYAEWDVETPHGKISAGPGDAIIRGDDGSLLVCEASLFAEAYEPVEAAE